jgi:hypothetical protein
MRRAGLIAARSFGSKAPAHSRSPNASARKADEAQAIFMGDDFGPVQCVGRRVMVGPQQLVVRYRDMPPHLVQGGDFGMGQVGAQQSDHAFGAIEVAAETVAIQENDPGSEPCTHRHVGFQERERAGRLRAQQPVLWLPVKQRGHQARARPQFDRRRRKRDAFLEQLAQHIDPGIERCEFGPFKIIRFHDERNRHHLAGRVILGHQAGIRFFEGRAGALGIDRHIAGAGPI